MKQIKIKVDIRIETDSDFVIESGYHIDRKDGTLSKIKYNHVGYKIVLELKENENTISNIINFLKGIKIYSHKDYLEELLSKGIDKYEKQLLDIGLSSSIEDLLSGNYSFVVDVYKIETEYL